MILKKDLLVYVCVAYGGQSVALWSHLSTFMWLWGMSGSNDFLENIFQDFKDWC